MMNEQQRSRLDQLRQREQEDLLTETERAELDLLVAKVEAAEAAYLVPATDRMGREREAVESRNRALEGLICRKQELVGRLRSFLTEAQAERRAIDQELAAVLADSRDSDADL